MMIARGIFPANTNAIAASAYNNILSFWNFLNFAFRALPLSDKANTVISSFFRSSAIYFTAKAHKKQQKHSFASVTHVTGIACGNGYHSHGVWHGIAPHANIVSLKILDRRGQGNSAQAVKGLRWIMDNARKYNIRVVNLSIGTNDRKVNLPLKEAAERLWQAGIVVVAAAGNPDGRNGYRPPPAVSSSVISVGAWEDRNYFLSPAFSRFTREESSLPDLWARGDDIVSVLSPDYDFSLQGRSRENIVGQHYIRMSGASMATPFISGAVALLLEKHPRARPDDIRRMLLNMADHGLLTEEMFLT